MGWHQLLLFLCLLCFLHSSLPSASSLCPPDQRDALLLFKNSFVLDRQASYVCDGYYHVTSYPKTNSWNKGVDCCSWDGVTCGGFTGNVLGLDLTCSWLYGALRSNSSLFLLTHLRSLNLFGNNFTGSSIPPHLSAFPNMTHLNLSQSQFWGTVPSEISRLSKLVSLDLSQNFFPGIGPSSPLRLENSIFPMLVQNLTELRNLVLDELDMSTVSPMSFVNLSSSLTRLSISDCSLQGIFPEIVFRIPNLTTLDLSDNYDMLGTLPKSNWTGPLVSLNVGRTSFSGEIPGSIGNMKSLSVLNLNDCNFTGHIPSSVASLKQLQFLDLQWNDFKGFVELEISTNTKVKYSFPKLEVVRLSNCNLTKFPWFLNSSKRLTELTLSWNRISGEIQLQHWKRLSYVDLQNNSFQGSLPTLPPPTTLFYASDNGFTGEIPSSICQSSSLWLLYLSNNNLSGNMPPCFGNITKLRYLDLSRNNLQGPLPRSLVRCVNLSSLDLSYNEFSDIFPHWLKLPQLYGLELQSNKFHGRINLTTFGLSFPFLKFLIISNNSLTGRWPPEIFSYSSLEIIDLSNNMFEGPIPLPSPASYFYSIANNHMTGKIPSLLCEAIGLEFINLSNNSLTGTLPQCLTNLSTNLLVLNLRMNRLEGRSPESFSSGNKLTTLDLSRNGFEGTLPRSLIKCIYLEVLDLSHNRIEDTFPRWLGTLVELKVLVLRSNNFNGLLNIPKGAHPFPKLHILDLSNNNFNGALPANLMMNLKGMMNSENGQDKSLYMTLSSKSASYENSITVTMKGQEIELVQILTIFTTIDLSHNSFQGDIPGVIGHLQSLIGLNLSHNNLTGYIPSTLGNLTNLGWLDLSSNKLSGGVPRELADLSSLGYLNLSKNQLTGRIPQDKQLSTFSSDSFSGNPGLCGTPLPKACPSDAQPPPPLSSSPVDRESNESWFKHETVWIGYASGVVIGMSIAYIAFETGRPVWLARGLWMLERRAAEWMRKPKWKAIRFRTQ